MNLEILAHTCALSYRQTHKENLRTLRIIFKNATVNLLQKCLAQLNDKKVLIIA